MGGNNRKRDRPPCCVDFVLSKNLCGQGLIVAFQKISIQVNIHYAAKRSHIQIHSHFGASGQQPNEKLRYNISLMVFAAYVSKLLIQNEEIMFYVLTGSPYKSVQIKSSDIFPPEL